MKLLDSFGAFVIDTFAWWIVLFVLAGTALYLYNSPRSVVLSEKEWECTGSVPDGISTRCIEYAAKARVTK